MQTRKDAEASLAEFMASNEKVVLITGTNEHRKHTLALQTLVNEANQSTILFRANYLANFPTFFGYFGTGFKKGTAYTVEGHTLFIDSLKAASWDKSPLQVDHAILYPLGSLCQCKGRERIRIVEDLIQRASGKIFIVSITDDNDYEWLSDIVERHVVYDTEEEDPEFDQRIRTFTFS